MLRRPAAFQLIVILLGGLVAGCDQAPKYRIAGRMPGLQTGAIVAARGQVVGNVLSVERRGETTFVRVTMDRKAAPLRAGDAVRTRRIGLGHELVFEIVPARHATPAIAPGAWLQLAPPALERPSDLPLRRRELEPPDQRAPPYQLLPPGPPASRAARSRLAAHRLTSR
jgi:hypothetical protein